MDVNKENRLKVVVSATAVHTFELQSDFVSPSVALRWCRPPRHTVPSPLYFYAVCVEDIHPSWWALKPLWRRAGELLIRPLSVQVRWLKESLGDLFGFFWQGSLGASGCMCCGKCGLKPNEYWINQFLCPLINLCQRRELLQQPLESNFNWPRWLIEALSRVKGQLGWGKLQTEPWEEKEDGGKWRGAVGGGVCNALLRILHSGWSSAYTREEGGWRTAPPRWRCEEMWCTEHVCVRIRWVFVLPGWQYLVCYPVWSVENVSLHGRPSTAHLFSSFRAPEPAFFLSQLTYCCHALPFRDSWRPSSPLSFSCSGGHGGIKINW